MLGNDSTYVDRLLPMQGDMRRDFLGDDQLFCSVMLDAITRSTALTTPMEDFDLIPSHRFRTEEMASHPVLLRFLQFLIQLTRAKAVLEIGAFIGVSTMSMARALPRDGHITSVEKFSEFAAICRQNFARNALSDRITLLEGDAADVLPTLPSSSSFDMIFLDGNKEKYDEHFRSLERLLAPRGLFVVDNMFCLGDALNDPPRNEKGVGVKRLLDHVAGRSDYSRVLLPVYDGVLLMQKLV
jgi:caffeoyl-CoA O-methyltransferase